jgi:peptidoglycan lytic transglycosylase
MIKLVRYVLVYLALSVLPFFSSNSFSKGSNLNKVDSAHATENQSSIEENHSLKTHTQMGVASWYGAHWHGRKTASGERFNMRDFTAAHKSLPLGAITKVTNLKNGQETIVKINDRGPYKKGRIIDLSHAAAKSIGMLKGGTAKVKVTTIAICPEKRGYCMLIAGANI